MADDENKEIVRGDKDTESNKEEEKPRWPNHLQFILSCMGYTIGLGNIWRFPYLCMRNGGGAFLLPYFVCLFLCGIPMFVVEVFLGQFSGLGPICVWKICPLVKGIGVGVMVMSTFYCIYYNGILAWTLYYFGRSFARALPWTDCDNPWNDEFCVRRSSATLLTTNASHHNDSQLYGVVTNETSTTSALEYDLNGTLQDAALNGTLAAKIMSPADQFWEYVVLRRSSDIAEVGDMNWVMLACGFAATVIVYLCICKGIQSVGKVVYFTVLFPYLLLFVLLIRGVTLPGAKEGVLFYLTPKYEKLIELSTWAEAGIQVFYTLGPCWGGIITMSSHNKFDNNLLRDSLFIPLVTCGTSLFAGFVVFSIIGFLAHDVGLTVEEVITSGPGLVFVAYPEALSRMPIAPFWSVSFFVMFFTVALDSQFCTLEAIVAATMDFLPRRCSRWKPAVAATICFIFFLAGLIFYTDAGVYYIQIVDWYCALCTTFTVGLIECVMVSWIYGWNRVASNIEMMISKKPGIVWRILICGVTPVMLMGQLVFLALNHSEPTYGEYHFPRWSISLGMFIAVSSVVPLPVAALHEIICCQKGSLWQRIKGSIQPTSDFGPSDPDFRARYKYILNGTPEISDEPKDTGDQQRMINLKTIPL